MGQSERSPHESATGPECQFAAPPRFCLEVEGLLPYRRMSQQGTRDPRCWLITALPTSFIRRAFLPRETPICLRSASERRLPVDGVLSTPLAHAFTGVTLAGGRIVPCVLALLPLAYCLPGLCSEPPRRPQPRQRLRALIWPDHRSPSLRAGISAPLGGTNA